MKIVNITTGKEYCLDMESYLVYEPEEKFLDVRTSMNMRDEFDMNDKVAVTEDNVTYFGKVSLAFQYVNAIEINVTSVKKLLDICEEVCDNKGTEENKMKYALVTKQNFIAEAEWVTTQVDVLPDVELKEALQSLKDAMTKRVDDYVDTYGETVTVQLIGTHDPIGYRVICGDVWVEFTIATIEK